MTSPLCLLEWTGIFRQVCECTRFGGRCGPGVGLEPVSSFCFCFSAEQDFLPSFLAGPPLLDIVPGLSCGGGFSSPHLAGGNRQDLWCSNAGMVVVGNPNILALLQQCKQLCENNVIQYCPLKSHRHCTVYRAIEKFSFQKTQYHQVLI